MLTLPLWVAIKTKQESQQRGRWGNYMLGLLFQLGIGLGQLQRLTIYLRQQLQQG